MEVDGVLVDVAEQEVGDLGQPRFGVAHGRRRIGIHRAEVALAVDQRHAHRPVLRHARERVVDRAVAVRVIFTHDVTDDAARLAIGPSGDVAGFLAGVEDAAVDRLQAVAHVGQRAADDHAHRVIEVAGLHLLDDGDRRDVAIAARRRVGNVVAVVDRRLSGQEKVLSLRVHAGNARWLAAPISYLVHRIALKTTPRACSTRTRDEGAEAGDRDGLRTLGARGTIGEPQFSTAPERSTVA